MKKADTKVGRKIEITATMRVIEKMIHDGVKVTVYKDGSYSMDWQKATEDITRFVEMIADTKMEVTIKSKGVLPNAKES